MKTAYIGFAINPLDQKLCMASCDTSKTEVYESMKSRLDDDYVYRRAFTLIDRGVLNRDIMNELYQWLRECGINHDSADESVLDFKRKMLKLVEDFEKQEREKHGKIQPTS